MENIPSKQEEKPQMLQMIIAKSSKVELMRAFNGLTLPTVVDESFPSIIALARKHGAEMIEGCVSVLVADLNETYNGDLSKDNIDEIAVEISTDSNLKHHSLESIYLACKELKSSDIYGKLTVNKVLKKMHQTREEVVNFVMERNYNAHLATKFTDVRDTEAEQRKKASNALNLAKTFMEIQNLKQNK